MAYQAVLEAITTNQMKPGDRLSEYMVADWRKISRTPAREGLRRLESEGLLTPHPRRGLVVATLDEAAIYELYSAREVIESSSLGFMKETLLELVNEKLTEQLSSGKE